MKHDCEPGIPGFLTDIIRGRDDLSLAERDSCPIRWKVSFQGKVDYECRGRRLEFRYAKIAWRDGYWNYESEEEFQRQHNGDWGILHNYYGDPVDRETLELFRKYHVPSAVTGYFDHVEKRWLECEPTDQDLSQASWRTYKLTAEFAEKERAAAAANTERAVELSLMAQ